MVILGGLEFVAAGYVLNELSKDNKKTEKKVHRRRSHDRKHHHRRDSYDRPSGPPVHQNQGPPVHQNHGPPVHQNHGPPVYHNQGPPAYHDQGPPARDNLRPPHSDNLRPPQVGPPRPTSAPPPGSQPMWQPQPFHGQPQQWQPQPVAYHPNAPRPSGPPAHMSPMYPPPGVHIDLKTGLVQNNLYPPGMQPLTRELSFPPPQQQQQQEQQYVSNEHHERVRSESDFYGSPSSSSFGPREPSALHPFYAEQPSSYSQPQFNPVPSPQPGYSELDSETPGRFRPYKTNESQPGRGRADLPSPPPAYY